MAVLTGPAKMRNSGAVMEVRQLDAVSSVGGGASLSAEHSIWHAGIVPAEELKLPKIAKFRTDYVQKSAQSERASVFSRCGSGCVEL